MSISLYFLVLLLLCFGWETSCLQGAAWSSARLQLQQLHSARNLQLSIPRIGHLRSSHSERYSKLKFRSSLKMAFDTFVNVKSNFESPCTMKSDEGVSLSNYMKLPVDQYVCIKMPLNATLERMEGNMFNLTVPPVRFFFLDVSPMLICEVTQDEKTVNIKSSSCILRGSPYVEGLNGCYNINVSTSFRWTDTPERKSITSSSVINVVVDPPAPFKYFGKTVLERTGTLAMSIALRQIENAFVQALSKDYERWANDVEYREARKIQTVQRNQGSYDVDVDVIPSQESFKDLKLPTSQSVQAEVEDTLVENVDVTEEITSSNLDVVLSPAFEEETPTLNDEETAKANQVVETPNVKIPAVVAGSPIYLTDDICLLPGEEPEVRIEVAPQNSRRIYTGVDIMADIEDVWKVLTDYESLHKVVPSLLSNEVVSRDGKGGARLLQVGGAKVLPGITFKAKTLLDINLYTEDNPIPPHMISNYTVRSSDDSNTEELLNYRSVPIARGVFPCPYAYTSYPHRDITMQNVLDEGDFDHYQGVWRVQSLSNCKYDSNFRATRLTYAVEIKPRGFLPVYLIENRIANDLKTNLDAIRKFVEANAAPAGEMTPTATSSSIINKDSDIVKERLPSVVNTSDAAELLQENTRLRSRIAELEKEVKITKSALSSIRVILDSTKKI